MSRPRIRSLKPEGLQHPKVGKLSDRAFRLWVGLVTQADDEGRLRWHPDLFSRVLVFAYHHETVTAATVSEALTEITEAGLAYHYVVDGKEYVELHDWKDHQKVDKPVRSILPARPHRSSPVLASPREPSRDLAPDRDQDRDQDLTTLAAPAPPAPAASDQTPPLAQPKPKRQKRDPLPADDAWLAELRETYKGRVDVDRELTKIDAWLLTPRGCRRRKTRTFIVKWMNRQVDEQHEFGPQAAVPGANNVVPLKPVLTGGGFVR